MKVEIANRLYEYRRASGMSQEKVASLLGVSRQAVSKWECAESSPDTENLIALAQLYGVSVDELLFADPEGTDAPADASIDAPAQEITVTVKEEADPEGDADEAARNAEPANDAPCGDTAGSESAYTSAPSDYVDISLERGVHVRDSRKGEEVHVGWDGIHIDNDTEHVHVDFRNFKNIAQAIRHLRKSQQ